MMIHIHRVQKRPSLFTSKKPSRETWEEVAKVWYGFYYTYYERDEKDRSYIKRQRGWLEKHLPPEFREGLHLLHKEGGFTGEDVWVVDGVVTHVIHVACDKCSNFSLLWRGNRVWCLTCASYESGALPEGGF